MITSISYALRNDGHSSALLVVVFVVAAPAVGVPAFQGTKLAWARIRQTDLCQTLGLS